MLLYLDPVEVKFKVNIEVQRHIMKNVMVSFGYGFTLRRDVYLPNRQTAALIRTQHFVEFFVQT